MIWSIVRPEPIASMLETTKLSIADIDRFVQQIHHHGLSLSISETHTRSMR